MSDCIKANEKDQKILDAATKFFLIHGFSGTTTDMIQKEAGFQKPPCMVVLKIKKRCSLQSLNVNAPTCKANYFS